jgi:hypothetical protein
LQFETQMTAQWNRLQHERERRIPRPRLGSILLQTAQITPKQLQAALARQQQGGQGRLGEWLVRLGFVEEHQVTVALSLQCGVPLLKLSQVEGPADAVRWVPGLAAKHAGVLPIAYDEQQDSLRLATSAPFSFAAQQAIRRMVRKSVETYMGDESSIDTLMRRWYNPEDLDVSRCLQFHTLEEVLEIVRDVAGDAVRRRAGNIQAELMESCLWVRLEFDGRQQDLVYSFAGSGARKSCSREQERRGPDAPGSSRNSCPIPGQELPEGIGKWISQARGELSNARDTR